MQTRITPRTAVLFSVMLFVGAWRFFVSSGYSPLTNFTPVGAACLFGGCYFQNKWKALLVPLATLWLSDLFINSFLYFHTWVWLYKGSLFSYASFALVVAMGRLLKRVSVTTVALAGVLAALTHWFLTDFGVWYLGSHYPKTPTGLVMSCAAGIPFLQNMLIGNLVFGGLLFFGFEAAKSKFPALRTSPAGLGFR